MRESSSNQPAHSSRSPEESVDSATWHQEPSCGRADNPRSPTSLEDPTQHYRSFLRELIGFSGAISDQDDFTAFTPQSAPENDAPSRFRLIRLLGRGGRGFVFLAEDRLLGREVALKVPRQDLLVSINRRNEFLREAQIAARLDHPAIVPVFEVGQLGPLCFLVSAYCRGPSLAVWLRELKTPVEFPMAARLLLELAWAVEHAHSRGVVHRDLKPANVLLEEGRSPRITDFGLAKLYEFPEEGPTHSGDVLGTLTYMAPEQARNSKNVGPAADLYSLGVILYELITGRVPFPASSPVEILRRLTTEEPVRPGRLRFGLSPDLEAICLRCLEKEPSRRYAHARDLADDLQRYLDGRPTCARPLGPVQRSLRWVRRHPAAAGLLSGVVLAVFLAFAGIAFHLVRLTALNTELASEQREVMRQREHLRRVEYPERIHFASLLWQSSNHQQAIEVLNSLRPGPGQPDHRDFAWYYLWHRCHGEIRTLSDNSQDIYHVRFSPSGELLASSGRDGIIRLWKWETGQLAGTLIGHHRDVNGIAFHPRENWLASGGDDGTVRVWDIAKQLEVRCLQVPPADDAGQPEVVDEAFFVSSPEQTTEVAAITRSGQYHRWQMPSGRLLCSHRVGTPDVHGVAVDRQGRRIACGDGGGVVTLTDFTQAQPQQTKITLASGRIMALAFDASGTQLACASRDFTLRLWDLQRQCVLASTELVSRRVDMVAFDPHNSQIVYGTGEGTLGLWDWATDTHNPDLPCTDARLWGLAFSPDGSHLATANAHGEIKIWDTRQEPFPRGGRIYSGPDTPWIVHGVSRPRDEGAADPASSQAVLAQLEGKVVLVPIGSPDQRVAEFTHPAGEVCFFAPAPDNRSFWASSPAGQLAQVSLPQMQIVREWSVGMDRVCGMTISPNGEYLAITNKEGLVQGWHLARGRLVARWQETSEIPASNLHFHPNNRHLVYAVVGGLVIRDLFTGEVVLQLKNSHRWVNVLALSANGQRLATGCLDRTLQLWDLEGNELWSVPHPHGELSCLAFSPDGRTVATGSDKGLLRFWSVDTGRELLQRSGFPGPIQSLRFCPRDQSLLLTTSERAGGHIHYLPTRRAP